MDEIKYLMKKNEYYPKIDDNNFQYKIFSKKEFINRKIKDRKILNDYKDIKIYRDNNCSGPYKLRPQQFLLTNYMNPDTPYKGLLMFHGVGTGKCVLPNTKVYINDNVMDIKNVWDLYNNNNLLFDNENGCWSTPNITLFTSSIDLNNNKMYKGIITKLYRQKIKEKINVIEFDNGETIRITKKHKLLSNNGWTNNFTNCNFILSPYKMKKIYNNDNINNKLVFIYGYYKLKSVINKKDNIITFFLNNINVKIFISYIEKIVENKDIVHNIIKNNNIIILKIYNKELIDILENIDNNKNNFLISENILKLNKQKIKILLVSLFNTSSSINIKNRYVKIYIFSCHILNQIKYLFKIFKINSIISNNNLYIYDELSIYNYYQILILNNYVNNTIKLNNLSKIINNNINIIIKDNIKCIITKFYEEDYEGFVYDFEVLNYHNYVINDIISHNTCAAISIADNFKENIARYDTKIYILVPGSIIKDNWMKEIMKCSDNMDKINNEYNQNLIMKNIIKQYYKIISYKSFSKKVLGEKIIEKKYDDKKQKITKSYKTNKNGEYERDFGNNRIYSLDNTLLIIDEVHNITGNEYGKAIKKIIKKSKNLRILLLSATPMKNSADEIVELLNYIRPLDDQIQRDKIFNNPSYTYQLEIKDGGIEYLREKSRGFISYFRGNDPLLFAKQIDKGEIIEELLFTKLIRCYMMSFQKNIIDNIKEIKLDKLDKNLIAASNFIFPILNDKKDEIIGDYSNGGLFNIKNNIEKDNKIYIDKLYNFLKDNKKNVNKNNLVYIKDNGIRGDILKIENLDIFSTKFYTVLNNLNKLGNKTAFIYSNLVKVGVDLFKNILLENGYLEYDEKNSYQINNNTVDHKYGISFNDFKKKYINETFYPATFLIITGDKEDDVNIIEKKKYIIDNIFNKIENIDGKFIKIILGSKVMNEGTTLENVGEVHILDAYYNLGKIYQAIGRVIRQCKHYKLINEDNKNPEVNVYRYVVSDKNITNEELLYKKAELKYIIVKKIEKVLKETALDCPLLYNGNIFPEELKKYDKCIPIDEYKKLNYKERDEKILCPEICNYEKCMYKCIDNRDNKDLDNLYDDKNLTYNKNKIIDDSTFNISYSKYELNIIKDTIKYIFKFKNYYTLEEIIKKIKKIIPKNKLDFYDNYFVYKSLNNMLPITENDFNNFKDIVYNSYNIPGYLIYRDNYYIYQPFNKNEDISLNERANYKNIVNTNNKSINDFLNYINVKNKDDENVNINNIYSETLKYYSTKTNFSYIGNINIVNGIEIFKIIKSSNYDKNNIFNGYNCKSLKKEEIIDIVNKLNIEYDSKNKNNKSSLCTLIKNKLFELEKYSTDKITYLIIPKNLSNYPFPLNIRDRIDFINKDLKIYNIQISNIDNINNDTFKNNKNYDDILKIFKKYHLILEKNKWIV